MRHIVMPELKSARGTDVWSADSEIRILTVYQFLRSKMFLNMLEFFASKPSAVDKLLPGGQDKTNVEKMFVSAKKAMHELEYTRALRDLLNLSKNQEWQSIQPADMQVNLIAFFEYMSSTISFYDQYIEERCIQPIGNAADYMDRYCKTYENNSLQGVFANALAVHDWSRTTRVTDEYTAIVDVLSKIAAAYRVCQDQFDTTPLGRAQHTLVREFLPNVHDYIGDLIVVDMATMADAARNKKSVCFAIRDGFSGSMSIPLHPVEIGNRHSLLQSNVSEQITKAYIFTREQELIAVPEAECKNKTVADYLKRWIRSQEKLSKKDDQAEMEEDAAGAPTM